MPEDNEDDKDNDLWTIDQVAEYLQVKRNALAQLRYMGTGPKYFALTPKIIRYRKSDIDAWVAASQRTGTADNKR